MVGRVDGAGPEDASTPRSRAAHAAFGAWSAARLLRPRERSCTRAPRPSRRTSTSSSRCSSPSRARRCARPRSSSTRRPTRSSTTPACRRRCAASHVHGLDPGVDGRVLRRPLGVVGAIVPWNFPTTLLCNKLGPALLCGNTVVAKPAEHDAVDDAAARRDPAEARPARRRVQRRHGRRPKRGEALVTHPLVRKVAFTGSTPVGERVALAAKGSKRVTLELGGSDPMIICDDADLAEAASAASMGRFYNCGQACLAIKRVYVFESVADEVIEAIAAKAERLRVGLGSTPGSQMGPLHTAAPARRARAPDRRAAGGEMLAGGGRARRPGARQRLVPRADRGARPAARLADGARGGLRPGAADLAREGHGRGDRARQRLAVRPRVVGVDARPRPRRARPPSGSTAATRGSTRARRSTTSCRSAAGSPAATARSTARRPSTTTPSRKSVVLRSG